MVEVLEFRGLSELNNFLKGKTFMHEYHILPVTRTFQSPETKLMMSVLTYVVVMA